MDVEGLTYRGVPAWDSLGHMALVAAIEEEFGVELDSDQVIDMASFPIALQMGFVFIGGQAFLLP